MPGVISSRLGLADVAVWQTVGTYPSHSPPFPVCPTAEANDSGDGVAAAATTALTALAVVSVLAAGGATAIYLFGGI